MIAAKNAKVDWKTVKLGEVVNVNVDTYSLTENWSIINYLDTGSVTENHIELIQQLEAGVDKIPSRARRKAYPNNILYSTVRPNQHHYAILKNVPDNFLVSTGFAVLDVIETKANPRFVYYFLSQDSVTDHLQVVAEQSVSTYPSLNSTDITSLSIPLPPLPTQRKIAAVLGALDDKIENNRKICANLEAQAQALFKSWFVDFEPFGGKMPKDWKMGKLGDVFLFKRGSSISKRDVVLKRDSENRFVVYGAGREVFGFLKHADINEPTVLITAIGAGAGDVTRSYERQYSVTSNAFYVSTKDGYHFPYAYYKLLNVDFHLFCTGSAQPMLAYNSFANEDVVVPCNKTIDSFCKYCWPLIKKIDSLKSLYYSLSDLRDTLLPKLMSGELDVDDVEV